MSRKKDDKTQAAAHADPSDVLPEDNGQITPAPDADTNEAPAPSGSDIDPATNPVAETDRPDNASDDADTAVSPSDSKPFGMTASGEAPPEDASAVAVQTRNAERFFRCGLQFGREWRFVTRDSLSATDWQRLLAEPHLRVQGVVLTAAASETDEDVPQ